MFKRLDPLVDGVLLSEWMDYPWWPIARNARIVAGSPGHESELVLNIDGYNWVEPIPEPVVDALRALLPDWMVENRGSRIELHPTGHFAGGFERGDLALAVAAITLIGLKLVDKNRP